MVKVFFSVFSTNVAISTFLFKKLQMKSWPLIHRLVLMNYLEEKNKIICTGNADYINDTKTYCCPSISCVQMMTVRTFNGIGLANIAFLYKHFQYFPSMLWFRLFCSKNCRWNRVHLFTDLYSLIILRKKLNHLHWKRWIHDWNEAYCCPSISCVQMMTVWSSLQEAMVFDGMPTYKS